MWVFGFSLFSRSRSGEISCEVLSFFERVVLVSLYVSVVFHVLVGRSRRVCSLPPPPAFLPRFWRRGGEVFQSRTHGGLTGINNALATHYCFGWFFRAVLRWRTISITTAGRERERGLILLDCQVMINFYKGQFRLCLLGIQSLGEWIDMVLRSFEPLLPWIGCVVWMGATH